MIRLFDAFLLARVGPPLAGTPVGEHGGRLPLDLPSPPPSGGAWWLIATPRVVGRMPSQRLRPALPSLTLAWSVLPTCPIVARQSTDTCLISPLGNTRVAQPPS